MEKILWKENKMPKNENDVSSFLKEDEIKKVREFHRSFPKYEETPLVELKNLAKNIGLKDMFVKDESYRSA